jgi:hypothetical protein
VLRRPFFARGQPLSRLFNFRGAQRSPFGEVLPVVVNDGLECRLEHLLGGNGKEAIPALASPCLPETRLPESGRPERANARAETAEALSRGSACASHSTSSAGAAATRSARSAAALGEGRRRREGGHEGDCESHSPGAPDPGTNDFMTNSREHESDSFLNEIRPAMPLFLNRNASVFEF